MDITSLTAQKLPATGTATRDDVAARSRLP